MHPTGEQKQKKQDSFTVVRFMIYDLCSVQLKII